MNPKIEKLKTDLIFYFTSFKGCISRKSFFILYAMALTLFIFVTYILMRLDAEKIFTEAAIGIAIITVIVVIGIGLMAVNTKRLHDIGLTGLVQILFIFLGFLTSGLAIIIGIIILGLIPTKIENNKFKTSN